MEKHPILGVCGQPMKWHPIFRCFQHPMKGAPRNALYKEQWTELLQLHKKEHNFSFISEPMGSTWFLAKSYSRIALLPSSQPLGSMRLPLLLNYLSL